MSFSATLPPADGNKVPACDFHSQTYNKSQASVILTFVQSSSINNSFFLIAFFTDSTHPTERTPISLY